MISTSGKHPRSHDAPWQPRELGTHLRIGELAWTWMEGMDQKEESRAFSATGE